MSTTEMSWSDADAAFSISQYLNAWNDNDVVRVFQPGAIVEGDIDLMAGNYLARGDLTIKGNLLSDDGAGFIVVLGNLSVARIISGGGQMAIVGELEVEGAIDADYNHGYLHVRGDVTARVIVAEHTVKIEGNIAAKTIDLGGLQAGDSFEPDIPRKQAVYNASEIFVSEVINSQGYLDGAAIAERLLGDLPILRDGTA